MLEIKTGQFTKSKKILVDGKEWTVTVLGAGDELRMSQATRRISQIEAKIKAGTATDADYDKYDELENAVYGRFKKMFRDGTPDNSEVNAWLAETPFAIVQLAIEQIKEQAQANEAETANNEPAKTDA